MAVVEPFRCNDEGFKRWLDDNPDGYVLNCYAIGKVHSARCPSYQSGWPAYDLQPSQGLQRFRTAVVQVCSAA